MTVLATAAAVSAGAQTTSSPAPGRLVSGSAGDGTARREYRLYVPTAYDGARLTPLIVFLHGCTQDADDVARGTRLNEAAERAGFLVLYPSQPASANALKCWNWFDPAHQQRGAGEPAVVEAVTRAVMREYRVDATRVHVGGISAGGAMAMIAAAAYPELYASVGSHSGVGVGAATDVAAAVRVMKSGADEPTQLDAPLRALLREAPPRPLLVIHGSADAVVSAANARQAVDAWARVSSARALAPTSIAHADAGARPAARTRFAGPGGATVAELVIIDGLGHAWSGGASGGTYVDPRGPSAAELFAEFFMRHPMRGGAP